MPRFSGFPSGRLSYTSVPDVFFTELLPGIEDLAELKITLHLIWLLRRGEAVAEWVCYTDLERDGVLLRGLEISDRSGSQCLAAGLRKAVERGTLLELRAHTPRGVQSWYLLNSQRGRRLAARVEAGELALPEAYSSEEIRPLPSKPTIFELYEQNLGPLQPIIADELDEARQAYPEPWVEEAFRLAAESNVRNWRYIRAILERWRRQGKDDPESHVEDSRKRYISGEYEEYRQL